MLVIKLSNYKSSLFGRIDRNKKFCRKIGTQTKKRILCAGNSLKDKLHIRLVNKEVVEDVSIKELLGE